MPTINLIKEQRLEARAVQRKLQIAMMSTMGVGALSLLATTFFLFDATRLNLQASALEQKKAELEPILAELQANTDEIEKLKPRLETLEKATKESERWERVLTHLTLNTPQQTWLSSVKAFKQDATTPMVLTFNGVSLTQESVGEFQLRLEQAADLENATLKFTQPKFSDKGRQFEFEISADLVGTKEEAEVAQEVQTP